MRGEIERRQRAGHDAAQAEQRLRTIQQILRAHEADRDRLRAESGPLRPA